MESTEEIQSKMRKMLDEQFSNIIALMCPTTSAEASKKTMAILFVGGCVVMTCAANEFNTEDGFNYDSFTDLVDREWYLGFDYCDVKIRSNIASFTIVGIYGEEE